MPISFFTVDQSKEKLKELFKNVNVPTVIPDLTEEFDQYLKSILHVPLKPLS